jgi:hypothetical protein
METLEQIKTLERIVELGLDDGIFRQTVDKLVSSQIQKQCQELEELQAKLASFERQYGLSSDAFHEKFKQGQLGDDADFLSGMHLYKYLIELSNGLHC